MKQQGFNVGDIVRKTFGKKLARVEYVSGSYVQAKYLESGGTFATSYATQELRHAVQVDGEDKNISECATLYSFQQQGREVFATKIGKNEQGLFVLELKEGAGIVVKSESELTEVRPYTVAVQYENNPTTLHYEVPKGSLEVGDVVVSSGIPGVVQALDTKSSKVRTNSVLRVLKTRPIS